MPVASQFNLILELDEGEKYFLQNTLTGKGAFIEPILARKLIQGYETDSHIPQLSELGSLVKDKETENLRLAMDMNRFRYSVSDAVSLTILTTSSCNLSCHYCYQSVLKELTTGETMRQDVEEKLISHIRDEISHGAKVLSVTWYGGEPLLNLGAILRLSAAFLELCRKNELEYSADVVTNATILNEELIKRLCDDCSVSSFQVTLESGRERHNLVRKTKRGSPTYHRLLDVTRLIVDRSGLDLRINVDATTREDDVSEVLEDLEAVGILKSNMVSVYLGRILYFLGIDGAQDSRQLAES